MKLHTLTHQGFRGNVHHWYFETEKSLVFGAGADMFIQYSPSLFTKEEFSMRVEDAKHHEVEEISDKELEVMLDEFASTGDRWRADELKKLMHLKVFFYVNGAHHDSEERQKDFLERNKNL